MEASDTPIGHVALTFDDGPTPATTAALVGILTRLDVRATMFMIGRNAEAHPHLVRAQVDAGLWMANHTWTHPHLTHLNAVQIEAELERTQQTIAGLTGAAPTLFRPPFLDTGDEVRAIAARLGLVEILTDIDSRDWAEGTTADQIVESARELRAGDVMLMHDWPPATLEALPRVVAELRRRGLGFGRIDAASGRAVPPAS